MSSVNCKEHGDSIATFVCAHVVETLDDETPRGFWWSVDDDGEYQAKCSPCEELSKKLSDEDWERAQTEVCDIQILCLGCYKRAAALNQVSIPGA